VPILLAVLAVIGLVAWAPGPLRDLRSRLPFGSTGCRTTMIEIVVSPTLQNAVTQLLAPVQGQRLTDDSCLRTRVRAQDDPDTVAGSEVLPASQAPQLWISESSLWPARVRAWRLEPVGSFGTSPVVLVTSTSLVDKLGWRATAPTWRSALDGSHTLAAPDLADRAPAQLAMIALWQTTGKGPDAERAVTAAVLAAARANTPTEDQALATAASGSLTAPLVATSEQEVVATNRDSSNPQLTAVYPSEGSPMLDYPIVRVTGADTEPGRRAGTDVVLARLRGAAARAAAKALGLRDATGRNGPQGQAGVLGTVKPLPPASVTEVTGFLSRLAALAVPSRMLAVVDVSWSMRQLVPGTGLSRVQLAGRAAISAGELMPDTSAVGLWEFATNLDGDKPYRQLTPLASLGSTDAGTTHRQVVYGLLAGLDSDLAGGGTGLYRTALDAVRALRADYDSRAVNTVVLLTDGTNENSPGITLDQLVQTLALDAAAAPDKPVRLVAIGLGPSADLDSLKTMVAPTKGVAYRAETPTQLRDVLYDAIARRS
jgi:hypothetical protein